MATRSKTTTVGTSATNVTAPGRSEFNSGAGVQWRSLVLLNAGSTTIHVALDGTTAVADADETVPVLAGAVLSGIPYMSTFSAIALTSASKLCVIGSDESAWR